MSNIKPLDLNLVVKGEEISVKFLFDLDKFSIQVMYSCLSQGKLYEPDLSYFLMKTLGKDDAFLDVGTHVGFFSVIAAKLVGPEGCVAAFEPEEENLQSLKKHVEINGVSNIEIVDKVVCDTDGPRTFYINRDNDGGHCLWDVGYDTFLMDRDGEFPKLLPNSVAIASKSRSVSNVLFSRLEFLTPY